ncbi:hypothetical protein BEN47_17570 [Hymenobacter lapidarius]|uniref:Uncharacterized protein n=1 Tax=Hymenobacter lapidarius TaxID=1908237 RepID=A0A1G1SXD0_9BACT|nr:hypothetical protein BEN47_17570 [Hymenobacter lapidarius]
MQGVHPFPLLLARKKATFVLGLVNFSGLAQAGQHLRFGGREGQPVQTQLGEVDAGSLGDALVGAHAHGDGGKQASEFFHSGDRSLTAVLFFPCGAL